MEFRRPLTAALIILLVLAAADAAPRAAVITATGVINPALSPRNASYTIDAALDPATKNITGSETIIWRNITARPAADLQFHLYWNAWRDDRSTWRREARLGSRRTIRDLRPEDRSRIDVTSLRVIAAGSAPTDLTRSLKYISPDDGNGDDRTVLSAPLPQSAPPGATLTIEVTWTAHVPRPVARTGVIGNFYFVAQWFPKLGVLQDEGWNCHQFHSGTEFFSDYGSYDVTLHVPSAWTVGATGVERELHDHGSGATHRFHQDDVHDFAWTTSPDYVERTARFEHPTLPAVDMRLLLQPEHLAQADRHFDATRAALKYYGEWFGPYPYGHITIVDPAYQSGADGMEYPTLFTAGTRWLQPGHVGDPEDVAIHEAGHQFWYGIVGTNEFENAWMDEGINTFSEARVLDAWLSTHIELRYFGTFIPWTIGDMVRDREIFWNRYAGFRRAPKGDAQSTQSFRYYPATGGVTTYNKTALWLNTMERWLGWPTVQRILSTQFARGKFRHPAPQEFFAIANEISGRDLAPFFDQVYRGSNVFDYGIQDLRSDREGDRYRTMAVVRRYGEATFPVDVRVTFENGERVTEHWDGVDRWHLYSYDRASKALSAEVDPGNVLLLDVNRLNNSRTLQPHNLAAATKWSSKWMVWLEDHLLSWSVFV
jgi:hypothetical protein